jgi:hypothetical protein
MHTNIFSIYFANFFGYQRQPQITQKAHIEIQSRFYENACNLWLAK